MRRIYECDLIKIYFTQIVKTRDLYTGASNKLYANLWYSAMSTYGANLTKARFSKIGAYP